MSSKKETLDFILNQMSSIKAIRTHKMMGEYFIYYRELVVADIYDDRFLVKRTPSSMRLLPDAPEEKPYGGAKPMLSISDIVFDEHIGNSQFINCVFDAIYKDLKETK